MSLSTIAQQVTGIPLAHEVENDTVKRFLISKVNLHFF